MKKPATAPTVAIEEAKHRYPDKLIGGDVKAIRQAFCDGWVAHQERCAYVQMLLNACACGQTLAMKGAYPGGHGYLSCVVVRGGKMTAIGKALEPLEDAERQYHPGLAEPCDLCPTLRGTGPRRCDACDAPLPPRCRRWCSYDCMARVIKAFFCNHEWKMAREAALERDCRKCVRCGLPEAKSDSPNGWGGRRSNLSVNHIEPRLGRGYGRGCWNHLDNLETLCWPCHNVETLRQRKAHISDLFPKELARRRARRSA